ncbi:MAG: hypothetical protein HY666_01160 [Chloroflexi bacterium]|nr:hypothetical protein [Chloroflexota bacterium]
MTLTLGWFSTGRGEGSRGLLAMAHENILSGKLDAQIQFVFSNREPGEAEGSDQFFALVKSFGIPLVTLSSRRFRREHGGGPFSEHRLAFDRQAMKLLEGFSPDLSVLAGYMLIAGPELCRKYDMINLHPALPGGPVGTWQEVIWKLIETRAAETGAMIHVATEELDEGPTVSYCSFPIRGEVFDPFWKEVEGHSIEEIKVREGEEMPLFKLIRREGVNRERPLLLETLKAIAQGRIQVRRGRVLDSQGRPAKSFSMNDEIEEILKRGGP